MKMKIKPCGCHHAYQDEKYGKGQRAHNPCKDNAGNPDKGMRCTVCGTKKEQRWEKEEPATKS